MQNTFSPNIGKLADALAKAQAVMASAKKDKANPYFKSKYADFDSIWEACRGPLTSNGISVVQGAEFDNGMTFLVTTLMHSSGEWIRSATPILLGAKQDMQSLGSAITYAKRYGLAAMAGVCTNEDDDGEAAVGRVAPQALSPEFINAAQVQIINKHLNELPHLRSKFLDSYGIDSTEKLPAKEFTRAMKGLEFYKQKESAA